MSRPRRSVPRPWSPSWSGRAFQAAELTRDAGVQLLGNSLATVFGLGVLIVLFGPVSGAHFNPVVSLAAWAVGRRGPDGLPLRGMAPVSASDS
ncbi:aquaporin [Amycolatopsis pigmentata]|uniref:Aquaporin n=1 Tax=Amycolatopsis pigmentata TaxID=450801 RepID=A0ABW5FLG5_9PSEU